MYKLVFMQKALRALIAFFSRDSMLTIFCPAGTPAGQKNYSDRDEDTFAAVDFSTSFLTAAR